VRDGETYELLVTSGRSLYRYKQGDLLKVAGFTNSCPIFEFVARRSQVLSLRGERVSEQAMMNALKECANTYWGGTSIVDFTCCASALADKLRAQSAMWPDKRCTTPPAVMGIKTFNETVTTLLFALADRNLGWMESGFSPGLYSTFTYLENTWERLVEDIRLGRISPDLNIPADIRQDLNLLLTPMPRRADELEREFSKGFTAICRRIWPNLRQLKTAASGSFALYAELLTEKYAKGVSIYSSLFNSSEAYMGINMWPGAANIHYLPTFTSTFFEFMPLSEVHKEQPKTYFLDQVRDGETYELLVTSGRSLYRYKQGDLLKVAGFTNSCPIFEFVARRSQLLSLRGERVSEQAMMNALKECANTYWGGTSIVDFTCCTSALADKLRDGTPLLLPHYIVFFELADSSNNNFLTAKQRNKLDDVLQRDVQIYKIERSEIYGIGAMEVHQVLQGTFAALHRYIHETSGSSYDQTKIPKLLLRTDHLKQLLARSTHTHIQQ
ncbi:PREDICTED: indole-3-acetic acid-amido synthetase GH3.3-like, partial [Priapulus caudatus]|uniref:Indole-3-acetic acid-amido synthetase GH3.3-like n=1 Tax=Priapulus caudatus TaxID=37621 RepID=A0ABM1F041_PRICU